MANEKKSRFEPGAAGSILSALLEQRHVDESISGSLQNDYLYGTEFIDAVDGDLSDEGKLDLIKKSRAKLSETDFQLLVAQQIGTTTDRTIGYAKWNDPKRKAFFMAGTDHYLAQVETDLERRIRGGPASAEKKSDVIVLRTALSVMGIIPMDTAFIDVYAERGQEIPPKPKPLTKLPQIPV